MKRSAGGGGDGAFQGVPHEDTMSPGRFKEAYGEILDFCGEMEQFRRL